MGGSPGDVGEVPMTLVKQRNGCRMSCDGTAHSPTLTSLHLRYSSFSIPSAALPMSQVILHPSVPSPTSYAFHLHHSSFSDPSAALPTSQLIQQPFCCFIYVTGHFTTLLFLHLHHRHFTYFTWRAAHA